MEWIACFVFKMRIAAMGFSMFDLNPCQTEPMRGHRAEMFAT